MNKDVRSATRNRHKSRLQNVLMHLEGHLTDPLSLEELAGLSGFSPHHFHRIFSRVVGETVKAHIRRLRLERAVYRLKTSSDTILDIALESGFKTHESFTRSFVRRYLMTPSEFRIWLAGFRMCAADTDRSYTMAGLSAADPLTVAREPEPLIPIRLHSLKPMDLAFIRYWGPYEGLIRRPGGFRSLWDPLLEWSRAQLPALLSPDYLGLCHDDPFVTPPDRIRFDACLVIPRASAGRFPVGCKRIEPGMCAVRNHSGGSVEIEKTFAYLGVEWQPPAGYRVGAAPVIERYSFGGSGEAPAETPAAAYVPLEKVPTTAKRRAAWLGSS